MTLTLENTLKRRTEILMIRMQDDGIERNCRDWRQYIKAKKLVEDMASSQSDYDRLIRIVIDYVGV